MLLVFSWTENVSQYLKLSMLSRPMTQWSDYASSTCNCLESVSQTTPVPTTGTTTTGTTASTATATNTSTSTSMTFDDALHHLGEFGHYQKRVYLLLCLPGVSCALHKLAGVFLQAKADHRCRLPFENDTAPFSLPVDILNMSYPLENSGKFSTCERLDANFTTEYFNQNVPAQNAIHCNSWIYNRTTYYNSAVMEFDLVCDDAWLRATADALFMVGVLLGSILFGDLSDRYGRRPIFFISLVLQLISGLVAAALPEYVSFMLARMLIGATTSGVFLVAYVIAMELVGPSKRLFAGVVCQFFFTAGYILTAFFAYFIKDWRMLQVALSLPGVVFLSYWWFVPESARWLLSKGRTEEAKQLLLQAAKENKTSIPEDVLDNLLTPEPEKRSEGELVIVVEKPSMLDLVRYPNLRKKSLNIFFNWFVNSGTYYGLSWNTSNLGGNDYLNFFISGAVEIPAYTFLLLTLNRWGRKTILCGCMLLGGISLLCTLLVPTDTPSMHWLLITFAMIGKLAITSSYGTIYVFSAEQFPTVIRNVGLGASSTCARVGGILAPYVNLLAEYWKPLPLLVFGALALAGGLLALLLPETLNKKLPDTIAEGEMFGKPVKEDIEFEEKEERINKY